MHCVLGEEYASLLCEMWTDISGLREMCQIGLASREEQKAKWYPISGRLACWSQSRSGMSSKGAFPGPEDCVGRAWAL